MAYIYKIINDINDKVYIGKTTLTPQERLNHHFRDAKKERSKNRPLYNAINKQGEEHFFVEEVEECDWAELNQKERQYIQYYNSYNNGYNATLGGEGSFLYDYDLIKEKWDEGQNIKEIAILLKCSTDTCQIALNHFKIPIEERIKRSNKNASKKVGQYNKNTKELIQIFSSVEEAYRFLGKQSSGHISEVCQGKRQSAYGYFWQFIE